MERLDLGIDRVHCDHHRSLPQGSWQRLALYFESDVLGMGCSLPDDLALDVRPQSGKRRTLSDCATGCLDRDVDSVLAIDSMATSGRLALRLLCDDSPVQIGDFCLFSNCPRLTAALQEVE